MWVTINGTRWPITSRDDLKEVLDCLGGSYLVVKDSVPPQGVIYGKLEEGVEYISHTIEGPPQPVITAAQVQARSRDIVNSWMRPLDTLPASDGLAAVVNEELPTPIPSFPYYALPNIAAMPVTDVLQSAPNANASSVDPLLESIRSSIWSLERAGYSEDTVHPLVEMLLLNPLRSLAQHRGVNVRTDRNSSGATLGTKRPDVLAWLPSGVLAFKGEDKAFDAELDEATRELSEKLATFTNAYFGTIPYQLCYALGGSLIAFFALVRKTDGGHDRIPLTDPVSLATANGRSLCVRYVVNITRILVKMQKQCPQHNLLQLGSVKQKADGTTRVTIFGDKVKKETTAFTGSDLKDLYTALDQARGVPGLPWIANCSIRGSKLTLNVSPVGYCGVPPKNIAEAKAAGVRILLALQHIHRINWVHRDLRPDNVMWSGEGWFLIDLEWANHHNTPIGHYAPQNEWTPPEITGADSKWTTASDMWQFGKLLNVWGQLDSNGSAYVQSQLNEDPSARLSAEDSLDHAFFKAS